VNWLGGLGLVLLTGLGVWARLQGLERSRVVMDALHPFLQAESILRGAVLSWRGIGSDFRYGALQAWLLTPLVAVAGDLRDLLSLYGLLQALGIVFLGLAGRRLGGWLAGFAAAALFACWPTLVEQLSHGAQTYLAPSLLAAAVWVAAGLLAERPRVARRPGALRPLLLGALLAAAVHQHPYALAPAIGALAMLPWLRRALGWRGVLPAFAAAVVVAAPMVVDNALLLWDRHQTHAEGGMLQDPQMAQESWLHVAVDAGAQHLGAWPPWVGLAVLLAPLLLLASLVPRREAPPAALPFLAWIATSWLALLLLTWVLGYLQPYHLAVLLPLQVLVGAWALAALLARVPLPRGARSSALRLGLGAALICLLLLGVLRALRVQVAGALSRPGEHQGELGVLEPAVAALRSHAGDAPRSLALLAEGAVTSPGEPVAYYLEQWLAGDADRLFPWDRPPAPGDPLAYVLADLSDTSWQAWPAGGERIWSVVTPRGSTCALLAFPQLDAAGDWLAQGCYLSGPQRLVLLPPTEPLGFLAGRHREPLPQHLGWARLCP